MKSKFDRVRVKLDYLFPETTTMLKYKVFFVIFLVNIFYQQPGFGQNNQFENEFLSPFSVIVNGLLGREIQSSEEGRLKLLPSWNDGQLIKMFSDQYRLKNKTNDWYGEHAGKWLYTTTLAANRTGSEELKNLLFRTADELISYQDKEGYLGSYSPKQRITAADYEFHSKSWDVWNLTYMTLGLLELNSYYPNEKYLKAAKKIGELFLRTFGDGKADITNYGTRYGLSSTIILESAVELYGVTKDRRYLDFCTYVLKRLNEREGLKLIPQMIANKDLELVGDGKIYQNIWNLYAIARFYEISPDPDYLRALENAWEDIYDYHLTPAGGAWGGIGKHKECFNTKNFFSPYGFVETCSVMSWIQFNKQMLRLTGNARYAEEIEKTAYNALLGAKYANGIDWSYHSFANGRRHIANFNDCCPSSGALALEELSSAVYSKKSNGISCNLYTESQANIELSNGNKIKIIQKTNYPFEGRIKLTLDPSKNGEFPLYIRIPNWAKTTVIKVNGNKIGDDLIKPGTFCRINRQWNSNDLVDILFPFEPRLLYGSENADAPQSNKSMYNVEWFALAKGPLIYSVDGLISGKEREEVIPLPESNPESQFRPVNNSEKKNAMELIIPGKKPIVFVPFFSAGERKEGSWRLTWLQKKIN